jgi:hypothetical protein
VVKLPPWKGAIVVVVVEGCDVDDNGTVGTVRPAADGVVLDACCTLVPAQPAPSEATAQTAVTTHMLRRTRTVRG